MQTGARFVRILNQYLIRQYLDLGNNKKVYGCKINDDDDPLWDRFSINAVPTLIAFEKGQIISRKDSKLGIGLKQTDIDSILSVI